MAVQFKPVRSEIFRSWSGAMLAAGPKQGWATEGDIVYRGDTGGMEYTIEPAAPQQSTAEASASVEGEVDLGRWRSGLGTLPSEEVAMQQDAGRV